MSERPQTNEKIGLERAQAVERYLYEQFQIPLHKMNIISYGESKPVGAEQDERRTAPRTAASSFACLRSR